MEVWKIVFYSILEIFHFISFWHLPYSIPKFQFHFIPFSFSFHTTPCLSILLLILLLHFTPTIEARLKIRKRLILKKLLPLSAPFEHFRFRVSFHFQPLSSKCFRFHKKLTASSFRFHLHIPAYNQAQNLKHHFSTPSYSLRAESLNCFTRGFSTGVDENFQHHFVIQH